MPFARKKLRTLNIGVPLFAELYELWVGLSTDGRNLLDTPTPPTDGGWVLLQA